MLGKAHFLMEAESSPLPREPEEQLLAERGGSLAGAGGERAPTRDVGACQRVLVAAGAGMGSAGFQGHLHWEMVADSQSLGVGRGREAAELARPCHCCRVRLGPQCSVPTPEFRGYPKTLRLGGFISADVRVRPPLGVPWGAGSPPMLPEGWWCGSQCWWAPVPQFLTHILALEVESLLEVVDGSRAGLDVLAQRSAAGDDAAGASRGC